MSQEIQYISEDSIVITLSELESEKIPKTIWNSENIKKLKIQRVLLEDNWSTFPPLSWFENRELNPPFWIIPKDIGKLENLEYLDLKNLDIHKLPASITKLQKLKELDLSFNKLKLSKELTKLGKLKNLKELRLFGNHYEVDAMEKFKNKFPEIEVEYRKIIDE